MKRVSIPLDRFLREVLAGASLSRDERSLLDRALASPEPPELEHATRQLVDRLIGRGALVVLDRRADGTAEWLKLRDPERRLRFHLRLPARTAAPELKRIELPLRPGASAGLSHGQVERLLAVQTGLISYERVLAPRDLAARIPQLFRELVPAGAADFHALEMPPGEDWPPVPWERLPGGRPEIEALSRDRDHLLLATDGPGGGSHLLLGIGDEVIGWRGLISLRDSAPRHFTEERISAAVLLVHHFGNLLTALVRLQGLIFYDYLTGIYNRTYFEEQLEKELHLARRREQSMAVLIADIDDFKSFNTRYGYEGGDRVLATAACVLKSALRSTDTLARYGGEEFAVILAPPVPLAEARHIAERLRAAVADEPLLVRSLAGETVRERITVSVGGAMHPDSGRTPRELWNAANRTLLEAKASGKNQVRFASDADARALDA